MQSTQIYPETSTQLHPNPIKIIIADDHQLFAEGVETILSAASQFEVIGKVQNGKLLMQTLNRLRPDLILLDINMPFMTGMEAAQAIKKTMPDIKLVFLSMYYDAKIIAHTKQYGINGFIVKDVTATELKEALLKVMQGETVFLLSNDYLQQPAPAPGDDFVKRYKLSPREIEIIQLIKKGKSTKEISEELSLSVFTIETHRKNIFRKLNIASVGQLISFAVENRI
jgi:DNA-binding NarL/FixJ family response regulator